MLWPFTGGGTCPTTTTTKGAGTFGLRLKMIAYGCGCGWRSPRRSRRIVDGLRSPQRRPCTHRAIHPLQAANRILLLQHPGRKQQHSSTESQQRFTEALEANYKAVVEIEAAAGIAIRLALRALQHPSHISAGSWDGFDYLRLLAPYRTQSISPHAHEEVRIFATGGVEAAIERVPGGQLGTEENIIRGDILYGV